MIKKAITTLLLTATTFNRVVVFDNTVKYDETNRVLSEQYTDIYRTEKQTSYGSLLTWQMVDIYVHDWQDGELTYNYRSDTVYKINNTNAVSLIEIEKRLTLTNAFESESITYDCYITQPTDTGVENSIIAGYVDLTPTQVLDNKDQIQQDLNILATNSQTQNANPLYYLQYTITGNASHSTSLDTTSNTPTTEAVMYIYCQIKGQLLIDDTTQINISRGKETRIKDLNSISTATIDNEDVEVIDLPGLLFSILTMPFSFISVAFNLTIFPGTPYQLNISNLIMTIIASLLLIFIIKKFIK